MIDTLKSICGQCTYLHNPPLDFIPAESQRQRDTILRDLRELVSCASLEHEKSVIVLAGVIFESALYCFIQSQSEYIAARRGTFTFGPEQSLKNYTSIFNRWFSQVGRIPDAVVEYRDMVHINRELELPPGACSRGAREMLRFLDRLFEGLEQYSAS